MSSICSKVFLVSLLSFVFSGCINSTATQVKNDLSLTGCRIPFGKAQKNPVYYKEQTKKWRASVRKNDDPKEQAEAYLHLTALYLDPGNPDKDYYKALDVLSLAVKTWPDLKNNIAVASWLDLLKQYKSDTLHLQKELAAMKNSLNLARQQIATQRHSLVTLQESIEKLKRAEMVVEEKRRAFR